MKRGKFLAAPFAAATIQSVVAKHAANELVAGPSVDQLSPGLVRQVSELIAANYAWAFDIFRHLNQCPEILFDLPQTAAKVKAVLETIEGLEIHAGLAPSSFVAILRNGAGKTLAYRTDLDGLPIADATTHPWSADPTILRSHCCGHSTHAAIGLAICKILSTLRSKWQGTFLFIAQASEEGGTPELGSGAQCMIRNGLFTRFPVPEAMLAIHVAPDLPVGKVRVRNGYAFAHTSMFEMVVHGIAGHGGAPYNGAIDAVLLASRIIDALQAIVSRELNPLTEPAIVSVGAISGGLAQNALPAAVRFQGTIRCFSEEIYAKITRSVARIANGQAMSAGLEPNLWPELMLSPVYAPQLYNDPQVGDHLRSTYRSVLPAEAIELPEAPVTFGEDFANYHLLSPDRKVATFLTWIGSVDPAQFGADGLPLEALPGLHHGAFSPYWHPYAEADTFRIGALTQACALLVMFGHE